MIDKPLFIILKDMAILQFLNEFILYYLVTPDYNLTGILDLKAIETFKKLINTNIKKEAYYNFRNVILDVSRSGGLDDNIIEIVRTNKDCFMDYKETQKLLFTYYDIEFSSYLKYYNL